MRRGGRGERGREGEEGDVHVGEREKGGEVRRQSEKVRNIPLTQCVLIINKDIERECAASVSSSPHQWCQYEYTPSSHSLSQL